MIIGRRHARPGRRRIAELARFRVALIRVALLWLALPALAVPGPGAAAGTLPLPERLVALDSAAGAELLRDSEDRAAYGPLSRHFVTQQSGAYCGVASMVTVLNALGIAAPGAPPVFTQDTLLDDESDAVLPRRVLARQGMTLDQLGALLRLQPVTVEVRHAADTTVEAFRAAARRHVAGADRFVIVNYLRRAIGQRRGGHISPLAAYDADSDRFLVLDVASYKYPPAWVPAADLFAAMDTPDARNDGRSRGYVLVRRRDAPVH